MPAYLCTACGLQFPPADAPPARCPVCDEARQYIPAPGQGWTTLEALGQHGGRELHPSLRPPGRSPRPLGRTHSAGGDGREVRRSSA